MALWFSFSNLSTDIKGPTWALRLFLDRHLPYRLFTHHPFPDHVQLPQPVHRDSRFPDQFIEIPNAPDQFISKVGFVRMSQDLNYALGGVSVGRNKMRHLCYGRGMCMYLYRSGNMLISMLWSVLASSWGTNGRANDIRGKDTVPPTCIRMHVKMIYLSSATIFYEV